MGKDKNKNQGWLPEGYQPIPPAVQPGQEGPAAVDRARRREQSLFQQQAGEVTFQAWRHQFGKGKGKGFQDREQTGGPIEQRGS